MKPERIKAHLFAAKEYAKLSKCKRLKVAALLVRDDRTISIGYNGDPSGGDNVCEIFIPSETSFEHGAWITKPEVLHAESNALMFAAKNGIATDGSFMVTTDSPCFDCAKLIIQAGVKGVYYGKEYRDSSGVGLLKKNNILVEQCTKD